MAGGSWSAMRPSSNTNVPRRADHAWHGDVTSQSSHNSEETNGLHAQRAEGRVVLATRRPWRSVRGSSTWSSVQRKTRGVSSRAKTFEENKGLTTQEVESEWCLLAATPESGQLTAANSTK